MAPVPNGSGMSPRRIAAGALLIAALAGTQPAPAAEQEWGSAATHVKLSNSGICHEPGSPFYTQTRRFKAYPTLDSCLRAGGRLPRGVKPLSPRSVTSSAASADEASLGQPRSATPASAARAERNATEPVGAVATTPPRESIELTEPAAQARLLREAEPEPAFKPWVSVSAGALALGGAFWWWLRGRSRGGASASAADDRRRWQDHRLSNYDRADEARLLLALGGDRAAFERLVQYEMSRDPEMAREQAIVDAYARWKRDNA